MPEKVFEERRRHPRYPVSLHVSLAIAEERTQGRRGQRISGKGRNISGKTGDISFEGLLVRANPLHAEVASLFMASRAGGPPFAVDLEIELNGRRIRSDGQIRWFKLWYTGQEPYQIEAGVFLREMDSKSRDSWNAYFRGLAS